MEGAPGFPLHEKDLAKQIMSGTQVDTSLNISGMSRKPPQTLKHSDRNLVSTFKREEIKRGGPLKIPRIKLE